ncbi:MAG TPA: IS481 family transposase [Actinomycetota bacterium]|nr:IS481 family transposase [Actinomycetota bacterium]
MAEQRFNAVMEVIRDGLTVVEVAERYGVSRQAVHGWLRRYRTGGLDALADRSHRPNTCPHQMPADLEAHICELRRHHPGWGQRRLAHELIRDGIDPPPGLTSIYRALVRNGLIEPKARRRRKADYRRWERSRPMQLWQMDVMGGVWLTDGRELKAVTGIDDHSRFCVAAGLVERANARAVCQVFTQALDRYGTPEELLTDNGKVFTGRLGPHPGEVLFDRICRERGITHRCTGVRCPTTTGKVERFHKTLRAELLTGRRFGSLALAQQAVDAWVDDYNTQRPHQGIAMAVPAQRFRAATADPALASGPPAQPARPATLSPTQVTRRVSASGLIGVCYQQVSAGRHLAGQVVTVRLHPTVLQVYFAGQLIRTVPRRSTKEVVQLRAHRPHRPKRPKSN